MKKKLSAFFMVALAIAMFMPTVEIGATSEMRQQRAELQQRRQQTRAQISESENVLQGYRQEIDELMATMQIYAQRLMDAEDEAIEIGLVLLDTEIRMVESQAELAMARESLEEQEALFQARLRAMHEQGPVGYLEVILSATSFSEFLLGLEHVRSISQFDQRVLTDMQAAESRVSDTVDELARLNLLFEDMYAQNQEAIYQLERAEEAHYQMLMSIRDNEAAQMALVEMERAMEQAILAELGLVERQIAAHEAAVAAEAERRRREEAAAASVARQRELNAEVERLGNFQGQFVWPLPGHSRISSPFGNRTHPITRRSEHHNGIDLPAPSGTRIVAAADGIVRTSSWLGGFGNTVIIDHGGGYTTLYAHNLHNHVNVGQRVTAGQHIADVGTTGVSTGNHLHFEIRRNGTPINPMQFFR